MMQSRREHSATRSAVRWESTAVQSGVSGSMAPTTPWRRRCTFSSGSTGSLKMSWTVLPREKNCLPMSARPDPKLNQSEGRELNVGRGFAFLTTWARQESWERTTSLDAHRVRRQGATAAVTTWQSWWQIPGSICAGRAAPKKWLIDLSWAQSQDQLSFAYPRFQDA